MEEGRMRKFKSTQRQTAQNSAKQRQQPSGISDAETATLAHPYAQPNPLTPPNPTPLTIRSAGNLSHTPTQKWGGVFLPRISPSHLPEKYRKNAMAFFRTRKSGKMRKFASLSAKMRFAQKSAFLRPFSTSLILICFRQMKTAHSRSEKGDETEH